MYITSIFEVKGGASENVNVVLEFDFTEKDLENKIRVNKLHLERIFNNTDFVIGFFIVRFV
jgi:hypothetical protein